MKRAAIVTGIAIGAAALAGPALGATPKPPDLVPSIPDDPTADLGTNNWLVDTTSQPGKVLLRFPAEIRNQIGAGPVKIQAAGPLPAGGSVGASQVVFNDDGTVAATRPLDAAYNIAPGGAGSLARYTLTPAGAAPGGPGDIQSAHTVTCLLDGEGPYVPAGTPVPPSLFPQTGCENDVPVLGITNGWGDVYVVSDPQQYFDVTGPEPGTTRSGDYTFTARVNPLVDLAATGDQPGKLLESNYANDQTTAPVTVPGVTATNATVKVLAGAPTPVPLPVTILAPLVKGGKPGDPPAARIVATPDNLSYALTSKPRHGKVKVVKGSMVYTPKGHFRGSDSFGYRARDARGILSAPATAKLRVGATNLVVTASLNGTSVQVRAAAAKKGSVSVTLLDGAARVGSCRTGVASGSAGRCTAAISAAGQGKALKARAVFRPRGGRALRPVVVSVPAPPAKM